MDKIRCGLLWWSVLLPVNLVSKNVASGRLWRQGLFAGSCGGFLHRRQRRLLNRKFVLAGVLRYVGIERTYDLSFSFSALLIPWSSSTLPLLCLLRPTFLSCCCCRSFVAVPDSRRLIIVLFRERLSRSTTTLWWFGGGQHGCSQGLVLQRRCCEA